MSYKKFIILKFFLFFLSISHANCQQNLPIVIVSVAPHQFFVKKIAADTLDIYLMVPTGASSHTYEPTPRQMIKAGQAKLWFTIGETFEKRAIQALQSYQKQLQTINLQKNLHLITHDHGHKGCCGSVDLHFWLSPLQAQIQAETIAQALQQAFPQYTELFQNNLKKFQKELTELHLQISEILAPLKQRNILVGHPAYAYFCRDFALNQHSIEIEGKDPTPQQMTKLLSFVKTSGIKTIFVQPQYNNKAAHLIAREVNAKLVTLDPYSENYIASMREIAHAIAEQ